MSSRVGKSCGGHVGADELLKLIKVAGSVFLVWGCFALSTSRAPRVSTCRADWIGQPLSLPLLYDGKLYFNKSNGSVLTCLDAKTGKPIIEKQRLQGLRGLYASPVGAAGRIYFTGRDGTTVVLDDGPQLKILATNKLDELTNASPALVGRQMFIRTDKHLYCIAEP